MFTYETLMCFLKTFCFFEILLIDLCFLLINHIFLPNNGGECSAFYFLLTLQDKI